MKVAIIIPYFTPPAGKLPNYFEYWQKAAAANEKIDFYIPSNVDSSKYAQYDNIHFITMETDEFWDKVQELAGFNIVRDYYKICEYRPLCGLMFKDMLADYDYWGYGDLDVIYGDILKFLQPFFDRGEEVIGRFGHLQIIKNSDKLRMMPFESAQQIKHPLNMKEAFSTKRCCGWDESAGMGVRYYQAGIKVVSLSPIVADINRRYKYFWVNGKEGKWGFSWQDGTLIGYNEKDERTEFLYVHFQKRSLSVTDGDMPDSKFCIVPNRVLNGYDHSPEINPGTALYTLKYRANSCKRFIKDQLETDLHLKIARVETILYRIKHGIL